eukprot:9214084-Alexandrium_andersonii.AAC.1
MPRARSCIRNAPQETNGVYYADKVKTVHVRAIKSLPVPALEEYENFLKSMMERYWESPTAADAKSGGGSGSQSNRLSAVSACL